MHAGDGVVTCDHVVSLPSADVVVVSGLAVDVDISPGFNDYSQFNWCFFFVFFTNIGCADLVWTW